ncbi:MAG: ribonuclease III [Vicinamibacteria bacterium]|nr:ribonuclease III [Vicinamibacteria bacterium]
MAGLTPERQRVLAAFAERIGHRFSKVALLERALTHSSYAHEDRDGTRDNEPLEFLGDAVLGFLVADHLHRRDPDQSEGHKSRLKAHLVSAACLARRAESLGLPDALVLGRGEERSGGRGKEGLWADSYEAVVAAVYLDGGIEAARRFVEAGIEEELGDGCQPPARDAKSALQELLQGRGEALPDYVVVSEEGPSHRRRFRVHCRYGGGMLAEGEGYSKKGAQQSAARKALAILQGSGPTNRERR